MVNNVLCELKIVGFYWNLLSKPGKRISQKSIPNYRLRHRLRSRLLNTGAGGVETTLLCTKTYTVSETKEYGSLRAFPPNQQQRKRLRK